MYLHNKMRLKRFIRLSKKRLKRLTFVPSDLEFCLKVFPELSFRLRVLLRPLGLKLLSYTCKFCSAARTSSKFASCGGK